MKNLLLVAVLGFTFSAAAADFNEIETVEIFEVSEQENLVELRISNPQEIEHFQRVRPTKNVGNAIMIGRQLIAFGKEIYKIIEAGKPVVSIAETVPVSVLPKNERGVNISAFDLEGWKMPKTKKYKVVAKNGFGSTMISFEFMLIFTYGGSYDGKGVYITGAEIAATEVEVGWGYDLSANFKVQSIVNQGTKDSPIAAAVLQISYTMKTVLKESRSTKKFMINGLGNIRAY